MLGFYIFLPERWQGSSCVELARLIVFVWRRVCATFCLAHMGFCLSGGRERSFVELAWFAFFFRVGLTQFFVGVALSESGGNILVGLGRQILWLGVELAQFLFCFRSFLLGFSIFLFARWQGQHFAELAWLTFLFSVGLAVVYAFFC